MIELPEAAVLAKQVNEILRGKRIRNVVAAKSPHKFAWFFGDPAEYASLLTGTTIDGAASYGGQLEVAAGDARITFSDGVSLRYVAPGEKPPERHQLLLEFDDGSSLVGSVQMYGGLMAFPEGTNDNPYYLVAKEKPSPLSMAFDETYFESLFDENTPKLSLKAFLATEQRIPGLGNGVLQDILFNAGMHPKKKVSSLSDTDRDTLFHAIRTTLCQMEAEGGRDTEPNLLGRPGGYRTVLSRNTVGQPCPGCGTPVVKEAYMGGSIYYCAGCQRM
jgi:formamidopyrimidine-DNA glycosylase